MKFLIITAIREFEKNVKDILNQSGVKSFSYHYVKGYKNESDGGSENWFGASHTEIDSVLFAVFIDENFVEEIYRKVEFFNAKQKSISKIHVSKIKKKKSI